MHIDISFISIHWDGVTINVLEKSAIVIVQTTACVFAREALSHDTITRQQRTPYQNLKAIPRLTATSTVQFHEYHTCSYYVKIFYTRLDDYVNIYIKKINEMIMKYYHHVPKKSSNTFIVAARTAPKTNF